jgi:Flp pilus assembly pilin Flp
MQRPTTRLLADERGQASTEQLALIVILAIVLISAASGVAAASPTIRNAVTTGFQRALCSVSGEQCVVLAREPCPMAQVSQQSGQSVDFAVLHFGHSKTVTMERRSDGTYVLSAQDGGDLGAGLNWGVSWNSLELKAGVTASGGLAAGRIYQVGNAAAANALLQKLKSQSLPSVRALIAGGADLLGVRATEPDVQAYTVSDHQALDIAAGAGAKNILGAGASALAKLSVGGTINPHTGEITTYAQLDAKAAVFFQALSDLTAQKSAKTGSGTQSGAAAAGAGAVKSLKITNPLNQSLSTAAAVQGRVALTFDRRGHLDGAEIVGRQQVGSTIRELHARLDLDSPQLRDALTAWVHAPLSTSRLYALGAAARDNAALDARSFHAESQQGRSGFDVAAGLSIGGSVTHASSVAELESERSRPLGGVWEDRLDCRQ